MILVCDTGPLVGAAIARDPYHEVCSRALRDHRSDRLLVPVTVAAEVDYLLRSRSGPRPARAFLADVTSGILEGEPVSRAALSRAVAIDDQYADADLGIVDASVVAVAEEVEADAILTLDHADFRLAAPGFTLLPAEHDL